MAFALGSAGARVAFNYLNDEAMAKRTFNEYRALGYEGGLFRASVIDEAEVQRLNSEIVAELGAISLSDASQRAGQVAGPCITRLAKCSRSPAGRRLRGFT